jgi:hypothetical protein
MENSQVLKLFKQGLTPKEIADITGLQKTTIFCYRSQFRREGKIPKHSKKVILKPVDGRKYDVNKMFVLDCIRNSDDMKAKSTKLLTLCSNTGKMSKPTLFTNLQKLTAEGLIQKVDRGSYQVIKSSSNDFQETSVEYPEGCKTPGQRAAYTRKLNKGETSVAKSTKSLDFIVNGIKVTIEHNKLKNVLIGTSKIIVNF